MSSRRQSVEKNFDKCQLCRNHGTMRLGVIFGILLVIVFGVTLWRRGKPPVP
jgi:hypothetical protein